MNTACPTAHSKKALFVVLTTIVTATFFASSLFQPVSAQNTDDTLTLTAIPPRVGDAEQIKLSPGSKEQVQLRIRNNSTYPISILTQASNFILDTDGQTPIAVDESVTSRWSLAEWLTIAPAQQTLDPQSTAQTSVLIEVPNDALPGGHYAMVTHEPTAGATEDGGVATAVNQKVGSLLYVIVDGPITEQAFIRDLNFPQLTEIGPVPFSFTVDNQSDIHIRPRLSIEIYNVLNKKIDTIELDSKNIFPLYSREFTGQWDRVWGHGYYTAKLIMSYGEQGNIAIAETSFWLFPVKIVLAIIIILLTIVATLISIRRHILHKKQEKDLKIKKLEEQLANLQEHTNQQP